MLHTVPIMQVTAATRDLLPSVTPVFNQRDLIAAHVMHIKIPKFISTDFSPYEIVEVSTSKESECIVSKACWMFGRTWIDIDVDNLNTCAGQHTYRISFVGHDNELTSLLFSYIIQSDSPEKPYSYMNRSE